MGNAVTGISLIFKKKLHTYTSGKLNFHPKWKVSHVLVSCVCVCEKSNFILCLCLHEWFEWNNTFEEVQANTGVSREWNKYVFQIRDFQILFYIQYWILLAFNTHIHIHSLDYSCNCFGWSKNLLRFCFHKFASRNNAKMHHHRRSYKGGKIFAVVMIIISNENRARRRICFRKSENNSQRKVCY